MRKIIRWTLPLVFYLTYGVLLSQCQISIIKSEIEPQNPDGFFDYAGVTHIQTRASIGSGSLEEVIEGAQESGLDFIVITDFNFFQEHQEKEGYYGPLLMLIGGKYSYLDSRFLLFGSLAQTQFHHPGESNLYFADALTQKRPEDKSGTLVLAHPLRKQFAWNGPIPKSIDGIEVVNLQSVWEKAWETSPISFLWSFFIYPFNPELALIRLYQNPLEELALWDELSASRKIVGFGGNDTRAKAVPMNEVQIKFPSYKTSFDFLRNHILLDSELTGHLSDDRQKVLDALVRGRFYISLDILANPKGFIALLKRNGEDLMMGAETSWTPGMKIYARLPHKPKVDFEIALFRNGEHIDSSHSQELLKEIPSPGVYRFVVRVIPTLPLPDGKKWIPWIYTNPFYIH